MGNKGSKKKKKEEAAAAASQQANESAVPAAAPESLPESLPVPGISKAVRRASSHSSLRAGKSQSMNEANKKSVLTNTTDDSKSVTGVLMQDISHYYSYTKADQLGSGHFGKVYKATNIQHDYVVALKVVSKRATKGDRLATLQNEINIMKIMKHDNIVGVFEALEDEHNVYIAMELCTGGELFEAIVAQPEAHFNERVAACVAKDLLRGIEYCHGQNVAHRDLKPENIILATDMPPCDDFFTEMKLIDFGLSRLYEDNTVMKSRVGTPYYIAPEVLMRKYGKECDLWSAGVIIYILLSGYPPFRGESDKEIYDEIKNGPLEFVDDDGEHIWECVSDSGKDFIRALVERDLSKRLTAEQALAHPWIVELGPKDPQPLPSTVMRRLKRFANENHFKQAAKRVIAGEKELCIFYFFLLFLFLFFISKTLFNKMNESYLCCVHKCVCVLLVLTLTVSFIFQFFQFFLSFFLSFFLYSRSFAER